MAQDTGVESLVEAYQKLKKWYLIPPLLNTQHYYVFIKGKVEQGKESHSSWQLGVVGIKKGAFESPSTTVGQVYLYMCYATCTGFLKLLKQSIYGLNSATAVFL